MVTRENVNESLAQEPKELDLLSIDINMNDFWVWSVIDCIRPRAVIVGYNASLRPPASLAVPCHCDRRRTGTNFFGASLSALERLASVKGYALVGCGLTGLNAYFVRQDLLADEFAEPYTRRAALSAS